MKIKAIMLGLALMFNLGISSDYSELLTTKPYKDKNGVTQYKSSGTINEVDKAIDNTYFDPNDPQIMQNIFKTLNVSKEITMELLNRILQDEADIETLKQSHARLNNEIKKLRQEMTKLKNKQISPPYLKGAKLT